MIALSPGSGAPSASSVTERKSAATPYSGTSARRCGRGRSSARSDGSTRPRVAGDERDCGRWRARGSLRRNRGRRRGARHDHPDRPRAARRLRDRRQPGVFLHGYGADGNDLIGLAEPLAPHLPNTRFLAPNAPERCAEQPDGLPVVSDPLARRHARGGGARPRRGRPSPLLDGWLDAVAAETPAGAHGARRLQPGHDDGAARRAAPQRSRSPASSASPGGCSTPSGWPAEIAARPPVLLVHGDQDPVVPFASLAEAEAALRAAGVETRHPCLARASATASRPTASASRSASSASGSGLRRARHEASRAAAC